MRVFVTFRNADATKFVLRSGDRNRTLCSPHAPQSNSVQEQLCIGDDLALSSTLYFISRPWHRGRCPTEKHASRIKSSSKTAPERGRRDDGRDDRGDEACLFSPHSLLCRCSRLSSDPWSPHHRYRPSYSFSLGPGSESHQGPGLGACGRSAHPDRLWLRR